MVCVYCSGETKVTNSRHQKRANQVWRRRQCLNCQSIFTTIEGVNTEQALRVQKNKRFEPFSRDVLLISVYDSLRHRKTSISDATALTSTIVSTLSPHIQQAALDKTVITEVATAVLERFDPVAATHYRAFHPMND